jgi:hypothetical protein
MYRQVLCEALFALACRHELTHLYDLDLRQISHPGLTDTVSQYLLDREAAWEARMLALLAARANNLRPLAGAIASVALNETEHSEVRYLAGSVALSLDSNTTATTVAQLAGAGDTDADVDPDDQLLGVGLAAALGAGEPLGAVLQRIREPRRRFMIGRYWRLLTQELPDAVRDSSRPVTDIVAAVAWAAAVESADAGSPAVVEAAAKTLDAIVLASVDRSWEDPRLGPVTARLLLDRLDNRHQLLLDRDGRTKVTTEQRHLLLKAVIRAVADSNSGRHIMWLAAHELAQQEDLQLLVDLFHDAATPAEAEAWARCAGVIFNPALPEHGDIAEAVDQSGDLHRKAFAPALERPDNDRDDTTTDEGGMSAAELKEWINEAIRLDTGQAFPSLCYRLHFQPDQKTAQLGLELVLQPGFVM